MFCKRIMVAIASKFATIQAFEVVLLAIDLLKQGKSTVGIGLYILHGIVVANHVQVKYKLYLLQRHTWVSYIPFRTVQTLFLGCKSDEIHVVFGTVL